ncbi:hypothetical protein ACSNOI_41560 [Actinomadura kijaniata]|uniref:hypothetical protein n=1 Tax=Actinomadura kijaniata TaxID=46161 RepID=UPI003F1A0E7A
MVKYYGLTFLPWIALAVVSDLDRRAGAATGLALAVALLLLHRRHGRPWDALLIEGAAAVYMAALTVLAVAVPDARILRYGAAAAIGWLAVTAWASLAAGRPFTLGIARLQVSPEIAATGLFRRINVVITLVWAAAFTLTAVALAVVQHTAPHDVALLVACKVAGFALPAVFTARYPDFVRKRHLAAHGAPESAR